jgi:excisionase family DNA binding protein
VDHRFFTKLQLARLLQVSVTTLNLMMKRGELPFLKINNRLVRFRLEDVQRRLTETVLVCPVTDDTRIDTSPISKTEIAKAETLKITSPQPSPQSGEGERLKGARR